MSGSSETQSLQQTMIGHHNGIESFSAVNTQVELDQKAEDAANKKKDEINAEIKKLNDDAEKKLAELDLKKKDVKITQKEIQNISVEQDAIIDNLFEQLQAYSNKLNEGNIPLPIKFGLGTWNFIKDLILEKINKVELGTEVTKIELEIVDIIGEEIERERKNKGPANPEYLKKLVELLISLKKQIQSKSAGEATGGAATPAAELDPGAAAAAAAAAGKLPPGAATAAAKALGGALGGKIPPGAAGALAGAVEAAKLDPAAVVTAAPLALAAPLAEASALATAAGGGQKGGGGGISGKRSHPKYMNQISENRNKIFKKELEIINSIRHFHRSHTIRKRDKINSILGLRKSRNNRNNRNCYHGNTKRHQHRHNKHKHKSAKHIKK
jgi:hypothetical protein